MDDFDPLEISGAANPKPSKAKKPAPTSDNEDRPNNAAGDELLKFIERVERLEEEKKALADDVKSVKAEAKGCGYDMPTFNEMLRLRKMDKGERDERESLRDTYGHALGIFG